MPLMRAGGSKRADHHFTSQSSSSGMATLPSKQRWERRCVNSRRVYRRFESFNADLAPHHFYRRFKFAEQPIVFRSIQLVAAGVVCIGSATIG